MKAGVKKIAVWIGLVMILIFLLLLLLLQSSKVQNTISDLILKKVSEQYDATWSIEHISVDFFDELVLDEVLLLDQQSDTLLASHQVHVDISLFSLIKKEIFIDKINFDGLVSNIYFIDDESNFNYSFLLPSQVEDKQGSKPSLQPWSIGLGELNINDLDLSYQEDSLGVQLQEDRLSLHISDLDIAHNIFKIRSLNLSGGRLRYQDRSLASSVPTTSLIPQLDLELSLGQIDLQDQELHYGTDTGSLVMSKINVDATDFLLKDEGLAVSIESLSYDDASKRPSIKRAKGTIEVNGQTIKLETLELQTGVDKLTAGSLQVDINTEISAMVKFLKGDISPATLIYLSDQLKQDIIPLRNTKLDLAAKEIKFDQNILSGSGVQLAYGDNFLSDLYLQGLNVADLTKSSLEAKLADGAFNIEAIKQIYPQLLLPKQLRQYQLIRINGSTTTDSVGYMSTNLSVDLDDRVKATLIGQVAQLNIPDSINYRLDQLVLDAAVEDLPIPALSNIDLASLGHLNYVGKLNGSLSALEIDGTLTTDQGEISSQLTLDHIDNLDSLSYKGRVSAELSDLGAIIGDADIKSISMHTTVDGHGINKSEMDAVFSSKVDRFEYKGYEYTDFSVEGTIKNDQLVTNLSLKDEYAFIEAKSSITNLTNSYPSFLLDAQINKLEPHKLNLVKDSLSISGHINGQISLPLQDGEDGHITITKLSLRTPLQTIEEDTVALTVRKFNDTTYLDLLAADISIDAEGIFEVSSLPTKLKRVADNYLLSTPDSVAVMNDAEGLGFINIKSDIRDAQIVKVILPDYDLNIRNGNIDALIDFKENTIAGVIQADSIMYDGLIVDSMITKFTPIGDKLIVTTDVLNAIYNDKYGLSQITIENIIDKGAVYTKLIAKESPDGVTDLLLSSQVIRLGEMYEFKLGEQVILKDQQWQMESKNLISYSKDKLIVKDLVLSDQEQVLEIGSIGEEESSYKMQLDNFRIESLLDIISQDSLDLSGVMNGKVQLRNIFTNASFDADLKVDSIRFEGNDLGILEVTAIEEPVSKNITTTVLLTGNNALSAKGMISPRNSTVDLEVEVAKFDLAIIDPFFTTLLEDTQGDVSGMAKITGDYNRPSVYGEITAQELITTFVANKTRYTFQEPKLVFTENIIDIGELSLTDSKLNPAILSGKIRHDYLADIDLDLLLSTDKFSFLGTTSDDNPIVFGDAVLATDITIKGPPGLLKVAGTSKTLEETDITMSPFSEVESLKRETFITYGKPDTEEVPIEDQLLKLARIYPYEVDLALQATDAAVLNFVIDPLSGDKIISKGDADLRVALDPYGNQELNGIYTVSSGTYLFSYGNFLKKEFIINEGSTIKFDGNPLEAILDIEAIYAVNTSTFELIKNDVNIGEAEKRASKLKSNINVHLVLEGSLQSPSISLDIRTPSNDNTTNNTTLDRSLADLRNKPNDLNHQVFGLLLFNSFLLPSDNGSDINSIGSGVALGSISGLITNQLNRLAGNAIKGVDIDFDMNAYNSKYLNDGAGGNVTELGLTVSKQLLNDRLKVKAGGNLNLEENNGSAQYSSVIGDFVLEYDLTENGNYKLKVFSRSNYDRLLDQNFSKNGVSIYFKKSFDKKIKK